MLFRIVVMVLGGVCFLIAIMDLYGFAGFQIKSTWIKFIVYLVTVICGLLFFLFDIVDMIKK